MRAIKLWERARASYWFVPSLMATGAIALSFVTIAIDGRLGSEWLDVAGLLFSNKAEGARSLLSTIASSMITVAGVSFSITIAAFAQASSQFGPRLISNFMRDRGNQITLGTFIATFIYCLMVLRSVQEPGEAQAAFVPHVSILVGLAFGLASLGVLIYFFHHIPESLDASNMVAGIGDELGRRLRSLREKAARESPVETPLPADFRASARTIASDESGYIQRVDDDGLVALARSRDAILVLLRGPGDFVGRDRPLALGWPETAFDEEAVHEVQRAFVMGTERSPTQDLMFLIDELIEVGARSLSPGINDPFTAMSCMDWLGDALGAATTGRLPGAERTDEDGSVRLIGHALTFERLAEAVAERLRPYLCNDRNAALHFIDVLTDVAPGLRRDSHRAALLHQADGLRIAYEQAFSHPRDRRLIVEKFDALSAAVEQSRATPVDPAETLRREARHSAA